MRPIKGIWYTLAWIKELLKFQLHYIRVWQPSMIGTVHVSREEFAELTERMATGPMRYEYQRIKALEERARAAWRRVA